MKRLLFLLVILLASSYAGEAQSLLKKIQKRTEDKIKREAERKVVEGISDELARRAMKPLDNAFDEMFRQSYKDQYGKEYDDSDYDGDPEERAAYMNSILNNMYGNVDLPEQYKFAYTMEIELTDFGAKKPEKIKMFIDTKDGALGIEQKQNKQHQIMVFDPKNDLVAIFDKKEKTVMAMPNMQKMAMIYGQQPPEREKDKIVRFEKDRSKKTILDYECQGYEMETEEYKSLFYVTENLPFSWTDSFGGITKNLSSNFYKDDGKYPVRGMMLEGTTKNKENGEESLWEVTKISDKTYTIKCKDYDNQNLMAER